MPEERKPGEQPPDDMKVTRRDMTPSTPSRWAHALIVGRPTIKALVEDAELGVGKPVQEYTCYDCSVYHVCPFAFDGYNTNGDCLAEK